MHYWWVLVSLGVGWNFLYVGGMTLLAVPIPVLIGMAAGLVFVRRGPLLAGR